MLLWRTFVLLTFLAGEISAKAMPCAWSQEPDPASGNKYRWVIPVPDPCLCTSVGLGPLNTRAPCRPFSVTYYDSFFISNDPKEIRKLLNCQSDSASGSSEGDHDSASGRSEGDHGTSNCPTGISLLRGEITPADGSSDHDGWYTARIRQMIRVKFTLEVYITGVGTKGRDQCDSDGSVKTFQVQFSRHPDGEPFGYVTNANETEFLGHIHENDNANTTFETELCARSIWILPVGCHGTQGCTMCFQLYGCNKP